MFKPLAAVFIADLVPSVPKVQTLITSPPKLLKYFFTSENTFARLSDSVSKSIFYTLGYPIFYSGE